MTTDTPAAAKMRLELSRQKLSAAMQPAPEPPPSVSARTRSSRVEPFMQKLHEVPWFAEVLSSVQAWWQQHPLRPISRVAGEASQAVITPIAKRSPWSFVAVSAVVGAGLAYSRPWRWIFRSAIFAGLLPQIAKRVVRRIPVESLVSMASTLMSKRAASPMRSVQTPPNVHTPAATPSSSTNGAAFRTGGTAPASTGVSPLVADRVDAIRAPAMTGR